MIPDTGFDVYIQNQMQECVEDFQKKLSSFNKTLDSQQLTDSIKDTIDKWATLDAFSDSANDQTLEYKGQVLYGRLARKRSHDGKLTMFREEQDLKAIKKALFDKTQEDLGRRLGQELAETVHRVVRQHVTKEFQSLSLKPSENLYQAKGRTHIVFVEMFQSTCISVLYEVLKCRFHRFTAEFKEAVDVCSVKWREAVAKEMFLQFSGKKDNFKKQLVEKIKLEFDKLAELDYHIGNVVLLNTRIRPVLCDVYARRTEYTSM